MINSDATLAVLRAMQDLDEDKFDVDAFKYLFDVLDEWLSNGGTLPRDWLKNCEENQS